MRERLWLISIGAVVVVAALTAATAAAGQAGAEVPKRTEPAASPRTPALEIRGFATIGLTAFSAVDSFRAVFGDETGTVYGGGGGIVFRDRWFFHVGAEKLRKTGERVFVFDGQVFPLGLDTTLTVTPVLATAGYRFGPWSIVRLYAGGGVGSYAYRETSKLAGAGEDVNDRFVGYHVVGGAEFRIWRWFSNAFEVQYARVPDALGDNGVSREFGESDLGGTTVRLRVVVGR
jgi:hypothetical protein